MSGDTVLDVGEYRVGLAMVTWMNPRHRLYYYARVWRKSNPKLVARCGHRHRTHAAALKCGKKYVLDGQVRLDFTMDR
jgi:hypothetical protein